MTTTQATETYQRTDIILNQVNAAVDVFDGFITRLLCIPLTAAGVENCGLLGQEQVVNSSSEGIPYPEEVILNATTISSINLPYTVNKYVNL